MDNYVADENANLEIPMEDSQIVDDHDYGDENDNARMEFPSYKHPSSPSDPVHEISVDEELEISTEDENTLDESCYGSDENVQPRSIMETYCPHCRGRYYICVCDVFPPYFCQCETCKEID